VTAARRPLDRGSRPSNVPEHQVASGGACIPMTRVSRPNSTQGVTALKISLIVQRT
jgi:hypothetical protein